MKELKSKILIAEDDVNFGMMLKVFLEMNGFEVTLCSDGNEALVELNKTTFSLAVFDIMMPNMDGYTLAEKVAKSHPQLPFIFLTAKALKGDQITGYQLGARDYLIKPFDPEVLLLKIKVILKDNQGTSSDQGIFNIGGYQFDSAKRNLTLGNKAEKLSPKEAALLKLLCEKRGEVLTHTEALQKVWKNEDYFTKQSMNVFISKLRKYLSKDTSHRIEIQNLHSAGFVLVVEEIA